MAIDVPLNAFYMQRSKHECIIIVLSFDNGPYFALDWNIFHLLLFIIKLQTTITTEMEKYESGNKWIILTNVQNENK